LSANKHTDQSKSDRAGDSTHGAYIRADHLTIQGGCDAPGRKAKGKYGTKHFPGVDKFPSGRLSISEIAKEFGITNTKTTVTTHSKEERITWLYHRIRVIRNKWITSPETMSRYVHSTLGLTGRATRDKPRLDAASASRKEWVTTNTDTGKRRLSSSSPALDRTSPFQPVSTFSAPVLTKRKGGVLENTGSDVDEDPFASADAFVEEDKGGCKDMDDDVSVSSLREDETDELIRDASNENLKITDKPTKGYRLRTRPEAAASGARTDSDEMSEEEQDRSEEDDSELAPSSEDQEHEEHDSDVESSPQVLLIADISRTHRFLLLRYFIWFGRSTDTILFYIYCRKPRKRRGTRNPAQYRPPPSPKHEATSRSPWFQHLSISTCPLFNL
jgi:hypothetical protein